MLKPEQVPSEAIREVMHKFLWHMNEEETPVGEAWSIVIAAAINAWPGMRRMGADDSVIYLPLHTENPNAES